MELSKIAPNWLKVMSGSQGMYVKINKSEKWETILDLINKY